MSMNTRQIEYEILRRLFTKPHYGYDLFVYLELLQYVSRSSQVYKILKRMEDQDLIKVHSIEASKYGKKKKNYTITPEGERSYLKSIIWKFIDLEVLYSKSIMIETKKQIEQHLFYFPFDENSFNHILFDHSYMFFPQELYEFYDFFSNFDPCVKISFQFQNITHYEKIIKKFNKKNDSMQLITGDSGIATNEEFEFIFGIGFASPALLQDKIEQNHGWLSRLKDTGTLCYIVPSEGERGKSDSIALIFTQFKHEIRRTIKELSGISLEDEAPHVSPITNLEIESILQKYFHNIVRLSILDNMDIFLCKTIKNF